MTAREAPIVDDAPPAAQVRACLMRAARYLRHEYLRAGEVHLSQGSGPVLALVERFGSLTPSQIARYARLQRPAVTRLLGQLQKEGLLTAEDDPADARSHRLRITDEARERLRASRLRRRALLSTTIQELPAGERAVLREAARVMAQLLEHANADDLLHDDDSLDL